MFVAPPLDPSTKADASVVDALIAEMAALPASTFVQQAAMTVAALLTDYPARAAVLGKYARVTDLWGSVRTVMICEYDGATYYWRPQRTDYAVANPSTSGAMPLVPLINAPVQILTGTLTGALTITPSVTNVWPGCQFTIVAKGLLGIFGINVTGLLGSVLPVVGGGMRTITYTASGWQAA